MIIDHDDGGDVDDEDGDVSAGDVCAVLRAWCTALVAR